MVLAAEVGGDSVHEHAYVAWAFFHTHTHTHRTQFVQLEQESCLVFVYLAFLCSTLQAMVNHLSPKELDLIHRCQVDGLSATKIHKNISATRSKSRQPVPDLTTVRRAVKGKTFKLAWR